MEQRNGVGEPWADAMEGRNPYAPPRGGAQATLPPAWQDDAPRRRPGRVYRAANIAYALLVVLGTLLLAGGARSFSPDVGSAVATFCFYAPVICFCGVQWASGRAFRWIAWAYGAFVLLFFAAVVFGVTTSGIPPWPVLAIFAINAAALLSGLWQRRRAQNP